jgi:hypothetical protein
MRRVLFELFLVVALIAVSIVALAALLHPFVQWPTINA